MLASQPPAADQRVGDLDLTNDLVDLVAAVRPGDAEVACLDDDPVGMDVEDEAAVDVPRDDLGDPVGVLTAGVPLDMHGAGVHRDESVRVTAWHPTPYGPVTQLDRVMRVP